MKNDNSAMARSFRPSAGFTTVELLVTITIIGLLAAMGYAAYTEFVERSRRSEATEALQNLATLQEQFYNHNKEYSNSLAVLGLPATTANDYYQLSITVGATVAGTLQSYTLNATALAPQTGDSDCLTIQIDSNGTKTPAACW